MRDRPQGRTGPHRQVGSYGHAGPHGTPASTARPTPCPRMRAGYLIECGRTPGTTSLYRKVADDECTPGC